MNSGKPNVVENIYSGPSLKGHSGEDTPLERTLILGNKYY